MKATLLLGAAMLLGPIAARADDTAADLYSQQCAVCHQADAGGAAGQYPPLKNRLDKIAATAEGRHYLADVLTHGMAGAIMAGGASYVGYMPSFAQLKDEQIAAILSWVSALSTSKPPPVIAASDVAAARARTLTAAGVSQERKALDAKYPLN